MTRRLIRWCLQRFLTPARQRQWLIDIYYSQGQMLPLLTRLWNERTKGVLPGQHPQTMLLGRPLFTQLERELVAIPRLHETGLRPHRGLALKSMRVHPFGDRHTVEFI